MGAKNGSSGLGFFRLLTSPSLAFMPGASAGVVYFLVGSVLGFFALHHASGLHGEWAVPAEWLALARSVDALHVFVVLSLLLLASRVWRLGKRCNAVEGLLVNAGPAAQALCIGGVICAVCGSKISSWKKGISEPIVDGVGSKDCSGKPMARAEEADTEEEDNAGEVDNAVDGTVAVLRRRLEEERRLKEAALEELEKERRAAASAADEAMAKIACLRNEKALVEREACQFRKMAEQKQMYDRQVIDSLQWIMTSAGMTAAEPEGLSDQATADAIRDGEKK